MMKIIYLSTARVPDQWAHTTQIMKTCEALAQLGHEVELVVPRRSGTRPDDPFASAGVERLFSIRKLPCIDLFPGTRSRLLYLLRTYSFYASARCYLAFARYDRLYTRELSRWIPFRNTVFELHTIQPMLRVMLSRLKRSRGVVTITAGIRTELIVRGVPAERITVAPDGVDLAAFEHPEPQAIARRRLGIPEGVPVALYIGLLDAWKGADTLYAAARLLAPAVRVAIIGESSESPLEDLRRDHPGVLFLGYRPYRELADNQAAADVLVLPNSGKSDLSARFTSPLKLFTYMASRKPIIASDLPSLREVLSDNDAFFVQPDDSAALAEGIRTALSHPEEAAARATAARDKAEQYTWSARASRINTLLSFIDQPVQPV